MCGSMKGMSEEWLLVGDEPIVEAAMEEFGLPGVIQLTTLVNNQLIAQNGFEDEMYELFCEREMSFFFAPATNISVLRH